MIRWAVHAIAAGALCAFPCAYALYLLVRSRHADGSFNLMGGLAIVLFLFAAFYLLVSTLAVAALGSSTVRVVVTDCVLFVAAVGLASRFDPQRDYFKEFKSHFSPGDTVRPATPSSLHLRVRLDSPASFNPSSPLCASVASPWASSTATRFSALGCQTGSNESPAFGGAATLRTGRGRSRGAASRTAGDQPSPALAAEVKVRDG